MNESSHRPGRGNLGWMVAAVLAVVVLVLAAVLVRGGDSAPVGNATTSGSTAGGASNTRTDDESGLVWVDLGALPAQAQATVALIRRGGPYPYGKDGAVFGNREGILPDRSRGYYHEYTVTTPGASTRGARRIVTGDGDREFFYTDDHYRTFRRVRV